MPWRVRLNNLRARGSILTELFQSTSREAGVIKWAQFLQCPPLKFETAKKSSKIFRNFFTTFDFGGEYLLKGSAYQKSKKLLIIYNPSHVGRKKDGVLGSTNETVIDSNKFTP